MKKQIAVFGIIFILAGIVAYLYGKVPAVQEKMGSMTDPDFREENIYTDLAGISDRLAEEILNGTEFFTIYIKNMDVDEITQVNTLLDGILGSGQTYQQIGTIGDTYKKVEITIKHTINYYAYSAYVNRAPIPESEVKAKKLYESMRKILNSQISPAMSDFEKELALHDYLVTHCRYSENTAQSVDSDIFRAYGALVDQDAVCNGYAEALQLLFMCAGIHSEFVTGTADGVDHAWNMVELEGKWYHVDATWDDPLPDQQGVSLHPYFNVTDEIMAKNHVWTKEDYPTATDMDNNYYVRNGTYFQSFEDYKPTAYTEMVKNGVTRYEAVIENYIETEDDMQFIFQENQKYSSVSWQTFGEGIYHVLVLKAE